ncbi:MAG: DUF402 domain-containing protein [Candidatus Limnocylindria bacterium]
MRVIETKIRLDGSREVFACEGLLVEPGGRAVLRYVTDREWRIAAADLRVPVGAVTISHYWVDRPYNVYHWLVDGRTLAYYCNVAAETEIGAAAVSYLDLTVDVLLRTSGAIDILDEDELPADLEARHRRTIADALEVLVTNGRRLAAEIERESRRLL